MTEALILVDIQNDYFPGGKLELVGMCAAAENVRTVLDSFRARKTPVIHIQHPSVGPDGTFSIPGSDGAEHHEKIAPVVLAPARLG